MKLALFILSLLIDLPNLIIGYVRMLLLWPWAVHKLRMTDKAVLTGVWRPYVYEKYPYSLTISRGVSYGPGRRREDTQEPLTRIEEHEEEVHVPQFTNESIKGLIVGVVVGLVTGNWILAGLLWLFSPAYMLANFVGALLWRSRPRPEGAGFLKHWFLNVMYKDSEHERSAYAQTDFHPRSWLARRRDTRDKE